MGFEGRGEVADEVGRRDSMAVIYGIIGNPPNVSRSSQPAAAVAAANSPKGGSGSTTTAAAEEAERRKRKQNGEMEMEMKDIPKQRDEGGSGG
ncbi:hypothetical protein DRE_02135 [Drechslerella stenobrocha 248]|uniref:Uncharacterized protein n=1 Tax=Drechslerella stenobrocha 248 TaxID=1043628 RepID=W7HW20_9PEZI|nr:hypothetical protein DRE_02135 [Drechslerella stenobrocha 248]